MSREDVVAILCRLFAVFLVVAAIREIVTATALASQGHSVLLPVLLIACPLLLAAALVWAFPLSIAKKLLPVMRSVQPDLDLRSRTTLEVALTAIGFWVSAMAIVDISYWGTLLLISTSTSTPIFTEPTMKANMVATVIEIIVGAWLLFGSKGLSQMALRLRYAGLGPADGAP